MGGLTLCGLAGIIRANDPGDQGMAYHIALLKAHDTDALDAFQRVEPVPQAAVNASYPPPSNEKPAA